MRFIIIFLRSLLISCLVVSLALAQPTGGTPVPPGVNQSPVVRAPNSEAVKPSEIGPEYVLSVAVLAFGILVVFAVMIVAFRKGMVWDDASFRAMVVPLIIFAGLFLMTAGYNEDQVAPMFGLLGTLIGYILGRRDEIPHPSK